MQRENEEKQKNFPSLTTVVVGAALVLTIAAVSIPNLLRSRIAANEASAVGSVRTINTAVASYVAEHPGQGFPKTLSELSPYIAAPLANGQNSGYNFRYVPTSSGYRVEATPVTGETGRRRYSSSENGVIQSQTQPGGPRAPLDGGAAAEPAPRTQTAAAVQPARRIMRKASMNLIVENPAATAEKIRTMTSRFGGYVESSRASGAEQVAIAIRIPIERFDEVRRDIRSLGARVRSEEDDANDVTSQYVDLESNLRNFHAEEGQYLEIMRRAGSIKDTLSVAERLADVRGRIERTQGQLNLLAHQTETSLLEVTLSVEPVAQAVDVRWHPAAEMKAALWSAADDLSTYANFMIVVLFRLPVFALWTATALMFGSGAWRLVRWMKRKLVPIGA